MRERKAAEDRLKRIRATEEREFDGALREVCGSAELEAMDEVTREEARVKWDEELDVPEVRGVEVLGLGVEGRRSNPGAEENGYTFDGKLVRQESPD